ncbi:MAG: TlpA family protein disulfide reductase [Saprospiraceae bacterium]|nr:TlpA family protein disulfide reductase [Saprospiraceae bacterium]
MKPLLFLGLLFWGTTITAQDIPFIKKAQLEHWLNADTDTVYVLNFWASWCGPCVAELPAFEKLNQKYASQNVKVVLISTDFKRNVDSKLKPFIKRKNLQSQVMFMDEPNPNVWVNLISPEWSGAIPATLIIAKQKGKRLFFEEQMTFQELEEKLRSVL